MRLMMRLMILGSDRGRFITGIRGGDTMRIDFVKTKANMGRPLLSYLTGNVGVTKDNCKPKQWIEHTSYTHSKICEIHIIANSSDNIHDSYVYSKNNSLGNTSWKRKPTYTMEFGKLLKVRMTTRDHQLLTAVYIEKTSTSEKAVSSAIVRLS